MKTAPPIHWWGNGSKAEVEAGMKIAMPPGARKPGEFRGRVLEYVRAAWCYEVEARRRQNKAKATRPLWIHGKPFSLLTQKQKDALRAEFPSKGWTPLPWVEGDWPATPRGVSAEQWASIGERQRKKPLPGGVMRLHAYFNPKTMDRANLHKAVDAFLDKLPKRKPRAGVRRKPYSWKMLPLLDRKLSGEALNEADAKHCNLILRRDY